MVMLKHIILVCILASMCQASFDTLEKEKISRTENRIKRCLNNGTRSKNITDFCKKYQRKISEMFGRRRKTRSMDDSPKMTLMQKMVCVPREPKAIRQLVAEEVSCSPFMKPLRNYWKSTVNESINFQRLTTMEIEKRVSEHLQNDSYTVVFTNSGAISNIDSILISVERRKPSDIGEVFARYNVQVAHVDENDQVIGELLYNETQYSCATANGKRMLIKLKNSTDRNIGPILSWLSSTVNNSLLKLRVTVRPEVQKFIGGGREGTTVSVIKNVTAILPQFVQTIIPDDKKDPFNQFPFNSLPAPSTKSRKRRSAASCQCNKISYEMNFGIHKDSWNIHFPKKVEIHECQGRCDFPLTRNMNVTNHGIVLKYEEIFNKHNRPMQATIDCVPVAYQEVFAYLALDDHKRLITKVKTKMIVTACGCR